MGNLRDKYTNEEWNELEKKVEQDSKSIEDLWFSILFGEAPEPNQALKDAAESYKEQKTKTCTGQCKNCTCKKTSEPKITHPPYESKDFQVFTDEGGILWERVRGIDGTWDSWPRLGGETEVKAEEKDAEETSKEKLYRELTKIYAGGTTEPIPEDKSEEFLRGDHTWGKLSKEGQKESNNKLSYELDWGFIQAMAERMQNNKKKYPSGNWKKPIDVELLKQSLFRHVIEVMKGNYEDDDRLYGHLEAIALNSMFINYQLSNAK